MTTLPTLLEQLKEMTKVVADTGDFLSIEKFRPHDATTNPSLVQAAAQMPEYAELVDEALAWARQHHGTASEAAQATAALDQLAVEFGLRILSNLADRRCSHVSCRVPPSALAAKGWSGEEVAAGIASASRFAELDPYRAATHNKGIMNGVDAVVLATGNDWRAIEAGAHAHAARTGTYRPLATWSVAADGHLEGAISLPTAVGTVGGATKVQPAARLALQILGPQASAMLGQVMAAVGLASNLAALRALATEGIQRGHMGLHARSVAIGAGALGHEIEILVARLIESGEVKHEHAVLLLRHLRQ